MLGSAAILLVVAQAVSGLTASRQNATADAVVKYGLLLGIDPNPEDSGAPHPRAADSEDYDRTGVSAWLSSQIEDESDRIEKPPPAFRGYLADHGDNLWALVAQLEKEAPEWDDPPDGEGRIRHLALTMRLVRLILAAALVEDHDGNSIESGRALEATWSLQVPFASGDSVLAQIVATNVEKLRAGVLRKIQQAPLSWQGRLSSDGPWKRMRAAIRAETSGKSPFGALEGDPYDRAYRKWMVAMNEMLDRRSPCEFAALSDEEIERSLDDALEPGMSEEAREIASMGAKILAPNLLTAARRAGRTEIDRELTLKVLQLRTEKDASPSGRWPDRLLDATSAACSSAEYVYRSETAGIELRFEGAINPPTAVPIVPLVFRSRQPQATPTATPTPIPHVLTPTPPAHRLLRR